MTEQSMDTLPLGFGKLSPRMREALQWGILGTVALALVGGVSFIHWQYINSGAFDPDTAFTLICH